MESQNKDPIIIAVISAIAVMGAALIGSYANIFKLNEQTIKASPQYKEIVDNLAKKTAELQDIKQQLAIAESANRQFKSESKVTKANVAPCPPAGLELSGTTASKPSSSINPLPQITSNATPTQITSIAGDWKGTFLGYYGITGITLTVPETTPPTQESGTLNFYPIPDNLTAKAGKYSVSIVKDTNGVITIKGTSWIERPNDSRFVTLIGTLTPDASYFSGLVDGNSRRKFDLKKVR